MDQGKRTKDAQGSQIQNSNKIGGSVKIGNAEFQNERLELFDKLYTEQQQVIINSQHQPITITLKDGKQLPGKAYETTPLQIAIGISKRLAEDIVVAKVVYTNRYTLGFDGDIIDADEEDSHQKKKSNFELWDLSRPLEGDCSLELLKFDDPLGKQTFWHSSAHILGAVLESIFGSYLCIGPPLENGFFYDSYIGEYKIQPKDYDIIEKEFQKLASSKLQFQKIFLTKSQALELFKANPFKVQLITNKIPENSLTTAYKCGKLIDLCTGPHLPTSDRVKAFSVTKNSAAYWLGKKTNDDLQRVYGISFPDKKLLTEYIRIQEELAKRDHRNVGKQFHLFQFHQLSPGSAFFYPHGAHIYNTLISFLRKEYKLRGFDEVVSPNFFNVQLWKTSGHYDKYKENMFLINMGDEGDFGVKPMNCPGHCLMFDMVQHSYRDLPIRYADFGVLHRNEVHGALSGLTRVRRFQQDDAHIFCRADQLKSEIKASLEFLAYVYKVLGFEYKLYLSTRPEKFLGTPEIWENAEQQLQQSLEAFGKPFEINEGDGAFYGPKIDVKLFDAYHREHQCGTIQLDFNLPERFNLQYRAHEEQQVEKQPTNQIEQDDPELNSIEQKETLLQKPEKQKQEKQKQEKQKQEKKKQEQELQNSDNPELKHQEKQKPVKQKAEKQKAQKQEQQQENQKDDQSENKSETPSENLIKAQSESDHHHLKPGFQRPIIIHRAILGSLERMIAVLTEQCGGKWPFWLSPKQVCICVISQKSISYAEKVGARLRLEGFQVDCELSDLTINKKIRNAQLGFYNFIGAVGVEEAQTGTIDIRFRDKADRMKLTVEEFILFLKAQGVQDSDKYDEIKQQAFFQNVDNELKAIDGELQNSTFLNSQFEIGPRDLELYNKLQAQNIDGVLYPNIQRWFKYIDHIQEKKQ